MDGVQRTWVDWVTGMVVQLTCDLSKPCSQALQALGEERFLVIAAAEPFARADENHPGTAATRLLHQPGGEPEENPRAGRAGGEAGGEDHLHAGAFPFTIFLPEREPRLFRPRRAHPRAQHDGVPATGDRKSTRLNSSHQIISYA